MDFVTDPFQAEFVRTGALAAAIVGVLCGVVGCFVVLRGMALMADSLAHGVLPGVAIAYLVTASAEGSDPSETALWLGALSAGLATALGTEAIIRRSRIREEAAAGVVFVFMLALGVVIVSRVDGYSVELTSFLFGDVLGVSGTEVAVSAGLSLAVLGVVAALYRPFLMISFDPQRAAALGLPVDRLHLVMLVAVTLAVVIGFRVVGALLVIGLLLAPPAAALLVTRRLPAMIAVSAGIGAASAPLGMLASWHLDIAAGGAIVLVAVAAFAAASLLGSTKGGRGVLAALAAAAALVTLTAAAGAFENAEDERDQRVTATTGILAEITSRVAGDDIDVIALIPDGASPHDFQLSATDRSLAERSTLLVHIGAGLEPGVPVNALGAPSFALAGHTGEPLRSAGDRGGTDPHIWMDPTRIAAALPALAGALAVADPAHAAAYRERARAFAEELTVLDGEIEELLRPIPLARRRLVTSHDALGYFAARYGLEVVATPFGATGPDAEPSAGRIREVIEAIADQGVGTVFAQADDDPEVLELIARQAGVRVVRGLRVESTGPSGTYAAMLRRDAELIAAGLGALSAAG